MSAKQIPIEFQTSTATEHGDGVHIRWTMVRGERQVRAATVCKANTIQPSTKTENERNKNRQTHRTAHQ